MGNRCDFLHFEGAILGWDRLGPKDPDCASDANEQRLASRVINRAAEQLATRFNPERIAHAVTSALHSSELATLRETLNQARNHTADVLATLHLKRMPTRDELLAQAQAMFVRTPSLDEIVDRAYHLVLGSIGTQLVASLQRAPQRA